MSWITLPTGSGGGGGGVTPAQVVALIGRNAPNGTAGLDANKIMLNENRPLCTKVCQYYGQRLDPAYDPDVWVCTTGGNGSMVYSNRHLIITGATGQAAANRAVIDNETFPITSKFLEITATIGSSTSGDGGARTCAIGFMTSFNSLQNLDRSIFFLEGGTWKVGYFAGTKNFSECPIGRNLQAGDTVTVRLDCSGGGTSIDTAKFFVNGMLQFDTTGQTNPVPRSAVYGGFGVFSNDAVVEAQSVSVSYFSLRYIP